MKRFFFLAVLLSVWVFIAQSQQVVLLNHYRDAINYYNPATAGSSGNLDLMALYRLQWVGFDHAPRSVFASANMPFHFMKREHGAGVVFLKDDLGSIQGITNVGLQYAYRAKMGKGMLRVGIQAGMWSVSIRGDSIITPGQLGGDEMLGGGSGNDEAIPMTNTDAKTFDANIGIYYSTDKFYLGVASMHVLEPEIDDENLQTFWEREYNFLAGYNIRTKNPFIELQPSVFVKTNFNVYQADITAKAVWMRRFSGGLSWRMSNESFSEALVLMLGASFGKIQIGYAYDFTMTNVRRSTYGSHELLLKYSLKLNRPKTGNSKHKSVRLL